MILRDKNYLTVIYLFFGVLLFKSDIHWISRINTRFSSLYYSDFRLKITVDLSAHLWILLWFWNTRVKNLTLTIKLLIGNRCLNFEFFSLRRYKLWDSFREHKLLEHHAKSRLMMLIFHNIDSFWQKLLKSVSLWFFF